MSFEFRTKIHLKSLNISDLGCRFMSFGSCFASTVHDDLRHHGLRSSFSPFGITYNPEVMAHQLQLLVDDRLFTESDLGQSEDGVYFSFMHHGDFSGQDSTASLNKINQRLMIARQQFMETQFLILTLGTSYVYRLKSNQRAVANCHKQPAHDFDREIVDHKDSSLQLLQAVEVLRSKKPDLQIIFTVSPVRHLRDSAFENSQSKAHLLIAAKTLTDRLEGAHYFPAYEIMIDELRDYRFYAQDMSHPSPLAVDYICSRFKDFIFKDTKVFQEVAEYRKRVLHRHRNPKSPSAKAFIEATSVCRQKIENTYPELNLDF